MHYEIIVCKLNEKDGHYYHLFATADRSCQNLHSLKEVYKELKEKFPEPLYKISVTYWENRGTPINNIDELK